MSDTTLSMSVANLAEFKAAIQQAKRDVRAEVEQAIRRSMIRVQRSAIRKIQRGPKTGAIYQLENPRRTHQASAPGEPPASDTGRLASSIETLQEGTTGWVFTRLYYGAELEFGTSKVRPRPWLLPSVEENTEAFRQDLRGILK